MSLNTIPLQKYIPFKEKDVCLFLGAITHNLANLSYPWVSAEDQSKSEILARTFANLSKHHEKRAIFRLDDTVTAQCIVSALRMYNADRESRDPRLQPALATGFIVTSLGSKSHPTAVAIDNLINDLEGAIFNACQYAEKGDAA